MAEVKFWVGTEKVDLVELTDKILVGIEKDGKLGHADVTTFMKLLAATAASGIEPTANPSTTLPAPEQAGKVMYMLGGDYFQPDGATPLLVPANSFNLGYWDGSAWSVPISIEIEADLSGYATKSEVDLVQQNIEGLDEAVNKYIPFETSDIGESYTGPASWANTTSTFSGWETAAGTINAFDGLSFTVRARDTAITEIKVRVRTDNDGTVLVEKTLSVNIQPFAEQLVEVVFENRILNASGNRLLVGYLCNALVDRWGTLSSSYFAHPPWISYGRYALNGNLNWAGLTDVTASGSNYINKITFLDAGYVVSDAFVYDLNLKMPELAQLAPTAALASGALMNAYKITDRRNSYEITPTAGWNYTGSTFSGWATPIGIATNIKVMVFKVRARDTAITSIYWELRETDRLSILLASGTQAVNVEPFQEADILVEHTSVIAGGVPLYFGFKADALVDFWGDTKAGGNLVYDTPPYGASAYAIGGDQSVGFTSEVSNQVNFPVATGTAAEPVVAPTDEFLQEIEDRIAIQPSDSSGVEVVLPDTIHAVVGDTLQLFYRGIVKAINPYALDILVTCSKGNQYPRYFQYTPVLADVGSTNFKISVKGNDGRVLTEKTVQLVTRAAVQSPSSPVNVLCVGDSLTNAGVWCQEASRRLIGAGGTPAGLSLSNINFMGRKTGGGIGWEGNGGWTWTSYATAGVAAYRFDVTGVVSVPSIGSVYTNNGQTFTVAEVNITSGTGYIRCLSSGAPTVSGTLTKTSGGGDATLTYSAAVADAGNPFWNSETNQLDFPAYVDSYMGGSVQAVYFLLTWNGQQPNRTDFSGMLSHARTLVEHMKASYPSLKVHIMGVQVPSLTGGMGYNYGATGTSYADAYGMVKTALNMNKAYQDWANEPAYSSYMQFIDVAAQFDSEYNMPAAETPVNTRSAITELRGTNGVHPNNDGYLQIADACFRNIIANYCQ